MGLHDLIDQAYAAFLYQSQNAQTILLHPNSRYRSVLVARLINSPNKDQAPFDVFYYALGPDDISIQSFISGITHDLANQHPTFGRHVNMLPQTLMDDPEAHLEEVLETFARDLSELSGREFLLVLDEYDRSDIADDVQRFLEKLIHHLPSHCRLVLNSRTLPRLPWVSLIARNKAILLEDDRLITRDFYNVESGKELLEVNALGPGYVLMNEQAIDTWEGHLPRLLFFFALDRPVITRSEICRAFWPELDIDQAVNVFHVTKRRLHKALDMDVLVHNEGYYSVNPDLAISYDVMDFVSALMAGRDENNASRIDSWQQAVDLYRGPFLQGHNDPWILDRRVDFRWGFMEALMEVARFWLDKERYEHALGLYNRAISEDFSREDIHREMMMLYNHLGRRSEAAAHYQHMLEVYRTHGYEPEPATQQLYADIVA